MSFSILTGEAAPHSRVRVLATCTYQPRFHEFLLVLQNSEWRIADIESETRCLVSVVKVSVSSFFYFYKFIIISLNARGFLKYDEPISIGPSCNQQQPT